MATRSDSSQAAALSRALRKDGWNPVSSDSPRRFEAALRVTRGVLGTGASVRLSSDVRGQVERWSDAMAADLAELGYAFERGELKSDDYGHTVWFRRVKKTEK